MLNEFSSIPPRERVIVALDCPADEALRLADDLEGRAFWLKVGMTLYYGCGPAIVRALKDRGFNVFLDLKLHDIPFQVEGAAASAAASGADMITMHAFGGAAMLAAGQRGVENACAAVGRPATVTLGITVLTSMDDAALRSIGVERVAADQVELLAGVAREGGIAGVVASPQEAGLLRRVLGPAAYIVTPGVRPVGADRGDQSRVATPQEAFDAGASHIVIGRPVTRAESPARAFDAIVSEIS